MTYLLDTPIDQRAFHKGITWKKFKLIEQGFSDSPGVKLFYYKGELEILTVGSEHEMFSGIIGMLLETFFLELEVEFEITGSMTQETEGEASAQAAESYCIGGFKRPTDLSVEVIFTSGSTKKLALYQALEARKCGFGKTDYLPPSITYGRTGTSRFTRVNCPTSRILIWSCSPAASCNRRLPKNRRLRC